jgi:hypothetical protein
VPHGAGNGLLTIAKETVPLCAGALAISAGLSLNALFALLMLRARPTAAPAPA